MLRHWNWLPSASHRSAKHPFVIDRILEDDRTVHRKQRHTAKRVFERLRDELTSGGQWQGLRARTAPSIAGDVRLVTLQAMLRRTLGGGCDMPAIFSL